MAWAWDGDKSPRERRAPLPLQRDLLQFLLRHMRPVAPFWKSELGRLAVGGSQLAVARDPGGQRRKGGAVLRAADVWAPVLQGLGGFPCPWGGREPPTLGMAPGSLSQRPPRSELLELLETVTLLSLRETGDPAAVKPCCGRDGRQQAGRGDRVAVWLSWGGERTLLALGCQRAPTALVTPGARPCPRPFRVPRTPRLLNAFQAPNPSWTAPAFPVRLSGCAFPPRAQGAPGSCGVFSAGFSTEWTCVCEPRPHPQEVAAPLPDPRVLDVPSRPARRGPRLTGLSSAGSPWAAREPGSGPSRSCLGRGLGGGSARDTPSKG